ncbi:MAG: winged helix-turn-helix domain-containing protein [Myxococcales bacterium]|nr:winged helix-turn-helix domain-containing protein [Myxococcales bacterium]
MSATILVVDDENDIVTTVEHALRREGYRTLSALNGRDAIQLATREPVPDLILLDLMLPDTSGTEICRTLRAAAATRDIPIVMLPARDGEIDRVVGFEVGADDFITKPFSLRELVLRIRAILRRVRTAPMIDAPAVIDFGCLRLDTQGHRTWVSNEEILLTALEFKLLHTFVTRRGRVQTREMLLDEVWGHVPSMPTRTVDTHIQRLRKKIGPASDYIETLRGVGYRCCVSPEDIGRAGTG